MANATIALLRSTAAALSAHADTLEAAPPAGDPPVVVPSGRVIDWPATAAATTAQHKATGKWDQVLVYVGDAPPAANDPGPPPVVIPPPVVTPVPPVVLPPPAAAGEGWDGIDKLSRRYGHIWDRDGMVTVASWAGEQFPPAGAMQPPTAPDAGQGYGVYTLELDASPGNAPGMFACLWPADDVWRWEIDIVEKDFNGNGIFTVHWDAHLGKGDQYRMYEIPGIRPEARHVYELTWAPGLLVLKVDGVEKARTTEHVPADFEHGGCNACLGVGELPGWAAHVQVGDNFVTAYRASYRRLA